MITSESEMIRAEKIKSNIKFFIGLTETFWGYTWTTIMIFRHFSNKLNFLLNDQLIFSFNE